MMCTSHYRADIDGLRALAVLSVVLFHAFPEMLPGGFVGVDVFFVISGFLITRILITDLKSNQFSLVNFYGRRIRRIFPALILVLLACLVLGWLSLLADEYAQLGLHMAAGAGFVSNWALWKESGYFDTASDLKPLLHLWSLGIEEQFYIFWPCIAWTAYKMHARLIKVILLFGIASFAWNLWTIRHDSVSAFYLPWGRAWELLIGAGLAWASRHASPWTTLLRPYRNLWAWLGLTLLATSALLLDKASLFPGGWALLPTFGTALLIASKDAEINRKILSHKWLVNIGLISFPLYLWHWPLLSWSRIMGNGEPPTFTRACWLLLSVLLATLTYHLVEKSLRHRGKWVTMGLFFVMLILGTLGWHVHTREGLDSRYRKIIELPTSMKRDFTRWEDKEMYPEGVCSPDFVYPKARICLQSKETTHPTTIVFGDSHAFHAYWGIARSLSSDTQVVKLIGRGGCPFGLYHSSTDCSQTFESQIDWIAANPFVKNVFFVHRLSIQADSTPGDVAEYQSRLTSAIQRLIQHGKQVVYLQPVPELRFNPRLCADSLPFGRKADVSQCHFDLERELARQVTERKLVAEWQKQHAPLKVFDPADTLCPHKRCQAVSEGRVLWMDDNHISETASYLLGEAIARDVQLK